MHAPKSYIFLVLAAMTVSGHNNNEAELAQKLDQILFRMGQIHDDYDGQASFSSSDADDGPDENINDMYWAEYKKKYHKEYGFVDNLRRKYTYYLRRYYIKEQMRLYKQYKVTFYTQINEFTDWFQDELERLGGLNGWLLPEKICNGSLYKVPFNADENLPTSFNWHEDDRVSEVWHQGYCSSDYAFSAIGALESHIAIKKELPVRPLSVQNVVDCSSGFSNNGCYGGMPSHVYSFLAAGNKINSMKSYRYTGESQKCQLNKADFISRETCKGCMVVPPGNETALQAALVHEGPISVSLAIDDKFYFYKGGIYNDPNCGRHALNHAMLLVGYGTEEKTGVDYWLLKNSWGKDWGENGYVRTLRNKDNHCGIATMAIFPII